MPPLRASLCLEVRTAQAAQGLGFRSRESQSVEPNRSGQGRGKETMGNDRVPQTIEAWRSSMYFWDLAVVRPASSLVLAWQSGVG